MSRELADAIDRDLSAEESTVRRYNELMATVDGDTERDPDELPVSTTPRFPQISFTESEEPNESVGAEMESLFWSRFSQFVEEERERP